MRTGPRRKESERVAGLSAWYRDKQLDFDKRLIRFRYESIKPYLKGPEGLELGPAEGVMTPLLLGHFKRLTVVDGAESLLAGIEDAPNLVKVRSLFEDFKPKTRFDTVVMEHILEHVEDPVALAERGRGWLAPKGVLIAGVPNGHSIHRLVGVKMGLLKEPCELNARDRALGHRRVYTRDSFRKDLEAAGLRVRTLGGVFFKPVSNQQIQDHWSEEMLLGFYELGKDFPENAANIFAVCEAR